MKNADELQRRAERLEQGAAMRGQVILGMVTDGLMSLAAAAEAGDPNAKAGLQHFNAALERARAAAGGITLAT